MFHIKNIVFSITTISESASFYIYITMGCCDKNWFQVKLSSDVPLFVDKKGGITEEIIVPIKKSRVQVHG